MRIVTLAENTAACPEVISQHGLSLYIETGKWKILFDMGQDDTFARNAEYLGIDLSEVDFAVLSHGHYDHGGGLSAFLRINKTAPVYIHTDAFDRYYNGREKYIGLDPALREETRLIFTHGMVEIHAGLRLLDCNELGWQSPSWGLNQEQDSVFYPDSFSHEQYLQITEGERQFLISGCSHKGIENIAEYFHPDVLIGGFHLSKQEELRELEKTARHLLRGSTLYYTGHCTGDKQYQVMKNIMGERLQRISTGMDIVI